MAQSNISSQFNQMTSSVLQLSLLKDIAARYSMQEASKAQEQVLKQRQAKLAKGKKMKQSLNQIKFGKKAGEINGTN